MLKLKYMFENFELAKQTLQNYEYDTDRLDEALSWFRISANAVYPFFCGGELCFLRLAPAEEKNFHDIQGEIEFIRYLRSCGYPAMEPIPARDGTYCFSMDTPWGRYYACAFRRVQGNQLHGSGNADRCVRRAIDGYTVRTVLFGRSCCNTAVRLGADPACKTDLHFQIQTVQSGYVVCEPCLSDH